MKDKVLEVKGIRKDLVSKYDSGLYDVIYMRDNEDKIYYTYIGQEYRNRRRWEKILELGKGTKITNCDLKNGNIINADSNPIIVSEPLVKVDKEQQRLI